MTYHTNTQLLVRHEQKMTGLTHVLLVLVSLEGSHDDEARERRKRNGVTRRLRENQLRKIASCRSKNTKLRAIRGRAATAGEPMTAKRRRAAGDEKGRHTSTLAGGGGVAGARPIFRLV